VTHETITLPGASDDEHRTLNFLLEQLDAKTRRNRLRAAYYDMRHAPKLIGSVIPPQYWRAGIVLGWSGKAVDTLARRTNLDGLVWPDGDLDSIGYRELWEDNNLGSEVSQGAISSLIHSVAFVINTQGEDGEPDALIHFKDALNATGTWNGRARRLDNLLSITSRGEEGSDKGKPTGLALYLDGVTLTSQKVNGKWTEVKRQEHAWGVPAEPLVYKPRVGRPFGSSRISRAVMSMQDAATRTAIRLEAHSDIYAIPDLWLYGAAESIFKNADGSQKASWEIVMGRIKAIPDDKDADSDALARAKAEQFPASSPQPHLDALKQWAQLFSGETSIPLTSLGVSDTSNPTSADSYIASREDLISEAEGATDDWRPALRRASIRGLAMLNGIGADEIPDEWRTIDTKWRSPIYLSRAQQADAGMKQLTAAPELQGTALGYELLGLDEQQVKRALADARRASGRATIAALTGVGNAGAEPA
jgi:Phage portal protein, SPP1 Gp6-like